MMSSSVAMEILCITNIGSISSKKIAGVKKLLSKCQIVIFFIENLQKYLKCTGKHSVKVQISIDTYVCFVRYHNSVLFENNIIK